MAKAPAKTPVKAAAAKKAAPKKSTTKKTKTSSLLEKTSEDILKKLKSLDLDHQLVPVSHERSPFFAVHEPD